jgi:hypothetical protein
VLAVPDSPAEYQALPVEYQVSQIILTKVS